MSAPRVSVVIAAYNAASTLRETLASVEGQTCEDIEIIVIDDGSTDDTPLILEDLARTSPRLMWARQGNAGVAAAREHAIALSQAELIAFVDADDLWLPRKLEKQVPLFDRSAVGLVYSDARDLFPQGEASQSWFQVKPPARGKVLRDLFSGNFVCAPSVVARKASLLSVGGFDRTLRFNEDYDLWLKLANETEFDYVDEVLVLKRSVESSLTHVFPLECHVQDLKSIDYWVKKRADLFPKDSALVRWRRARAHARIGYQSLSQRDFQGARKAYWQSLALGQTDPATILRFLASMAPPMAYLFWSAKSLRKRFFTSR